MMAVMVGSNCGSVFFSNQVGMGSSELDLVADDMMIFSISSGVRVEKCVNGVL